MKGRGFFAVMSARAETYSPAAQLHVLWNVLVNGAAILAGGDEAVQQGHLLPELAAGQGFHGLSVVFIRPGSEGQRLDSSDVHTGKGIEIQSIQLAADLGEALVAARLEHSGRHGNGPNADFEKLADVERVGTAGVAQPQLAAKLTGDAGGHSGGKRKERFARHVHLLAGQLPRP